MQSLLGARGVAALSAPVKAVVLGNEFFPNAIAPAVMSSLRLAFYISAAVSAGAFLSCASILCSTFRKRTIY